MKTSIQKNVILQLGALIALYASVTSLLILIFNVTNLKFPDAAAYYWEDESAREAVRNSIAVLVVFFPAYLVFTRFSNQDRRSFSNGEYVAFAKWLVFSSILGGILILLGDLVTLINYFLNGEITTRFLVKVFALFAVVGVTLHYYILDVRGYFKKRVDKAMYFGMGAIALVLASLSFGYSYIETPAEVREMRLDEQQVTDLQDIYWHMADYYRLYQELPPTIDAAYTQTPAPLAPENRDAYQFKISTKNTFELCATFMFPSPYSDRSVAKPVISTEDEAVYLNQTWEHGTGKVCYPLVLKESTQ